MFVISRPKLFQLANADVLKIPGQVLTIKSWPVKLACNAVLPDPPDLKLVTSSHEAARNLLKAEFADMKIVKRKIRCGWTVGDSTTVVNNECKVSEAGRQVTRTCVSACI